MTMPHSSQTAISVKNLSKSFGRGDTAHTVFRNLTFDVARGTFTAIVGKSGCGKSTLLQILAGLEPADSGQVVVGGVDVLQTPSEELAAVRLRTFGIVFQFFNLLPTLSLLDNVALPAFLLGLKRKMAETKALELLAEVGLSHRTAHYPHQVSGGEVQRAAIARALINNPKIIFADEPTGNLDAINAEQVLELFLQLAKQHQATLLVVTHDDSLRLRANHTIGLGTTDDT